MFHGLSSPDELKSTWFNMTEGQNLPTLHVIWEFDDDALNTVLECEALKKQNAFCPERSEGLYVCNLTYKYIGNHTGHYVAIFSNPENIIYFDPLGTLPPDWIISRIFDLSNSERVSPEGSKLTNKKFVIDLEGAQAISGTSCGYRCLTKLLKYSLGVMPKYKLSSQSSEMSKTSNSLEFAPEGLKDLKPQTIKKTKREIEILKNLKANL